MRKQFVKYVSQNMLGMLGMSLYILADTFFISKAVGADGITALNLALPIYNLIFCNRCNDRGRLCYPLCSIQKSGRNP